MDKSLSEMSPEELRALTLDELIARIDRAKDEVRAGCDGLREKAAGGDR